MHQKTAIVCGAGGFIGGHLVNQLKARGIWVRGVDLKINEHGNHNADDFVNGDLRDPRTCDSLFDRHINEVYQLAADMGGAGYLFTGDNDADVMHNSALINLNMLDASRRHGIGKILYASSACVYPIYNQNQPDAPNCAEDTVYPAMPDSEYGWEKLFSERIYHAYQRNHDIEVRIARFHGIFGPQGTWCGGREKAPAAICRKAAEAEDGAFIDIWGDGNQTRSFLYIDECIDGILRLMASEYSGPVNIGSDRMITINQLVDLICEIAGKRLIKRYDRSKPQGVRGRNSDNALIAEKLHWRPSGELRDGFARTYAWIQTQVEAQRARDMKTNGR